MFFPQLKNKDFEKLRLKGLWDMDFYLWRVTLHTVTSHVSAEKWSLNPRVGMILPEGGEGTVDIDFRQVRL